MTMSGGQVMPSHQLFGSGERASAGQDHEYVPARLGVGEEFGERPSVERPAFGAKRVEVRLLARVRQAQRPELSPAVALHTDRRGLACDPDGLWMLDAIWGR